MIGELIPTGVTFGVGRNSINSMFSGTAAMNNIELDSGGDFSGGTGGGIIYSAGTDLYNIFLTSATDATTASAGLTKSGDNITLGGVGSPLTGDTILLMNGFDFEFKVGGAIKTGNINTNGGDFSGGTGGGIIYSGGTDLYSIFAPFGAGGGGGSIVGTGTTNTIAKWDSISGLTDSLVTDDGINVSVYSEKIRKKSTHDFGTSGGTVNWDIDNSSNSKITLSSNLTLNISNIEGGDFGTIKITQDGVGSHTITLGTGTHKVANGGGGSITLTATAAAEDIINFFYDGSVFYWNVGNDYT